MLTEIQDVPTGRLSPHPDNPRLQLREDVIERIAAEITRSGFGREHAPLVRPHGDGYQIISGHHRIEAATRAGLAAVPCWVKDMDDDEAFMQLVLSNTQGELSPLEIGMHALKAVPQAQGKAGSGLQEYADRIGMARSGISMLRNAAEVASALRHTCDEVELTEKSRHLYEISKAPREVWPVLVDALVKHGWSVKDAAGHVERVKAFEIGDLVYAGEWLPIANVVERYLAAPERFTPRTVARLTSAASEVEEWIEANAPDRLPEFHAWLVDNRGGESWDHRAIIAYQQRLLAERWKVTGWHHGDWREHLDELDDGSVALLLTDPPYGVGYQSGYRTEQHEAIANDATLDDALAEMKDAFARLHSKLAPDAHLLVFCVWSTEPEVREAIEAAGYEVRGSLVWVKNNTGMGALDTTFAPKHERIVHAVKGSPRLLRRAPDALDAARPPSERHPTEKPVALLAQLIEATTSAGQIVADPFAGVASTCVAAKEAGRKWWGCELEEKYWAIGEERLS